ncbi:ABC transporter permease [Periweissella fabalis]|uniref:ABC transporter permease n=1 Tax=Periweissella fabalis TaxID=1070421 RepID=A0A7X6S2N2_9LACO|nr:ABC transporter permease [Periweissella fabalis]MCM0599006.1 ABC transporter permease [Periweissella fabalis]NKZ23286.1 ABC transporter permease [Periweissella fabalis]
MQKKILGNSYVLLIMVLLYIPIIFLVAYSFNSGTIMSGWSGFSFIHYQQLFADTRLLKILLDTFILAISSATIAAFIGTIGALFLDSFHNKKNLNVFSSLNNVLLVSPDVTIGVSFLILFTILGFSLGFVSVLISHIAFSIPIVLLMVLPRLREMDNTLIIAARDLGANRGTILSQIVIPEIWPSIMAGFLLALTYSLDDFAVTFFVTGNGFSTLSVEIYSRARQGVSLEINALSALMFAVSLLLVLAYYLYTTYSDKKARLTK